MLNRHDPDRELWLAVRRACLMVASAIEKRYNLTSAQDGPAPRRTPAAPGPDGAAAPAPAPPAGVEHG